MLHFFVELNFSLLGVVYFHAENKKNLNLYNAIAWKIIFHGVENGILKGILGEYGILDSVA